MAKKKKSKPVSIFELRFYQALEWLKEHWLVIAFWLVIILTNVSFAVGTLSILRGRAPSPGATDAAQSEITSGAAQSDAATQAKIEDLEAELFELREDIATINARIEASIVGREAVHDEIDNANSIERVNRVLRDRRITGATNPGTTRETSRPDFGSDGVDANPYR